MDLIRRAHTEGHLTVLMVTHDPGIAAHAQEVIRMRDGQIQGD
jgi:macrolide transport system ATP-binding/permease protein